LNEVHLLCSKVELEFCFLTNQLTGPLTLLDCLERFQPELASRESLVIHVAGASLFEMIGIIKWECKSASAPSFFLFIKCFSFGSGSSGR
jgi:hypothetical protein